MHLTDEQFTSYLLGAPDADVREHLERCAICRAEAHLLSETVLQASVALRSEAATAQAQTMQRAETRRREAERTMHTRKNASVWALAPVLATIVVSVALLFSFSTGTVRETRQGASPSPTANKPQSPIAQKAQESEPSSGQSQANVAVSQSSPSEDDDALLRSIQEDASREVPAALEPAVVIVDEHDRIAELRNSATEQR